MKPLQLSAQVNGLTNDHFDYMSQRLSPERMPLENVEDDKSSVKKTAFKFRTFYNQVSAETLHVDDRLDS